MHSEWPYRTRATDQPSNMNAAMFGRHAQLARLGVCVLVVTGCALLSGCVAQQADLKQTERELQRRIKQQTEEQAQNRARQNQEIVSLREQDIPSLRGDVDKALHRAQSLDARQEESR